MMGTEPKEDDAAGRNIWDAMIALIVVGSLLILVIFLVQKYGSDVQSVTSVLGVVAPVLAAAFGVSIGYYTGSKAGQSAGEKKGRREVRSRLEPVLGRLDQRVEQGVLDPIITGFASPAGSPHYEMTSSTGAQVRIAQDDVTGVHQAVATSGASSKGSSGLTRSSNGGMPRTLHQSTSRLVFTHEA